MNQSDKINVDAPVSDFSSILTALTKEFVEETGDIEGVYNDLCSVLGAISVGLSSKALIRRLVIEDAGIDYSIITAPTAVISTAGTPMNATEDADETVH